MHTDFIEKSLMIGFTVFRKWMPRTATNYFVAATNGSVRLIKI